MLRGAGCLLEICDFVENHSWLPFRNICWLRLILPVCYFYRKVLPLTSVSYGKRNLFTGQEFCRRPFEDCSSVLSCGLLLLYSEQQHSLKQQCFAFVSSFFSSALFYCLWYRCAHDRTTTSTYSHMTLSFFLIVLDYVATPPHTRSGR